MSALAQHHIWTVKEYADYEKHSQMRHEYVKGVVYAMTGGSPTHALIGGNVYVAFDNQLSDGPCHPYNSDLGISILAESAYTYPDVSVVCGDEDFDPLFPDRLLNPILVVEVLSRSTEEYDRTTKFNLYKAIPSLQHYLLVRQDRVHVTHHSRQGDDWPSVEFSALTDEIALPDLNCTLRLKDIYKRVTWDHPES